MALERTFFMIKPDGVKRYLSNLIISKMMGEGFRIVARKRINLTMEQAENLYSMHKGKAFYPGLIKFIMSGPVIMNVIEGESVISKVREMMGATDPRQAAKGTIRGDNMGDPLFTDDGIIMNICHGSDSPENAKREISIFFNEAELK